jgi:hypothetical protein
MTYEEIMRRAASGLPFPLVAGGGKLVDESTPSGLPDVDSRTANIRTVRAEFDRAAETIKADKYLSAVGKREKLAKLAQDTLAKIEGHTAFVGEAGTALAALRRPLPAPPSDPTAAFVAMEVRQRLAKLDPLDLKVRLDAAIENNDAVVFSAVVDDPLGMAGSLADEAKQAWTAKFLPEKQEEAEVLQDSIGMLEATIQAHAAAVRREAGVVSGSEEFVTVSQKGK